MPFLSPGDLPDQGVKPGPPVLQVDALPSELLGKPIWLIQVLLIQARNLDVVTNIPEEGIDYSNAWGPDLEIAVFREKASC